MHKAKLLLIFTLVSALLALAILPVILSDDGEGVASSVVRKPSQAANDTLLPKLSEAIAQSSPNFATSQTDNSTAPVISSGAVKASFTVVSGPVSDQGESGMSSTGDVAGRPNTTPATAAAREENAVASDDQPMQNDHLATGGDVRPKSGWVAMGWVLLITVWSVEIVALCALLFIRACAKKWAPSS